MEVFIRVKFVEKLVVSHFSTDAYTRLKALGRCEKRSWSREISRGCGRDCVGDTSTKATFAFEQVSINAIVGVWPAHTTERF